MTATTLAKHTLGPDGPPVSALGIGTWALGGPFTFDGRDAGWGEVDDEESIRAVHAALDRGVTLIDTAPTYGTGHSERIVGRALAALPDAARARVRIATKFGLRIDEESRTGGGTDVRPATIRAECDASLRRLGVDAIDLYQLHGGAESPTLAEDAVATCEDLVAAGKINYFGTGQDDDETLEIFARSPHCVAVQTQANVFGWSSRVLETARRYRLAVLARSPLAMGLLSGKYNALNRPATGDVRLDTPWWTYFDEGSMQDWLRRLQSVRELLTTGGRTLVQGSLGYLWALDSAIIPLPGVRTTQQAVENTEALAFGLLPADIAEQITTLLADSPERS